VPNVYLAPHSSRRTPGPQSSLHYDNLHQVRIRRCLLQLMDPVPAIVDDFIIENVLVDDLGRKVEREAPAAVDGEVVAAGLEAVVEEGGC
jgi:hypothetical protein